MLFGLIKAWREKMKEGDLIRVVRVPTAVADSERFKTQSLLERCVSVSPFP
jgi:hypothetical protein